MPEDSKVVMTNSNDDVNVPVARTAAELEAELQNTREALKKANREAAERRKAIEQYEAQEKERAQAQLSESEKQTQSLKEAQQKAQDAETRIQQMQQQMADERLRSAFIAEAARQGAAHPEDAFALADRKAVQIAEDGTISGVDTAVKTLLDAGRLPVSGRGLAPNLNGGAGRGAGRDGGPQLSPEQLEMAAKLGLTPEQYAKGLTRK